MGGYLHLSAARSLVQGTLTLADIPEILPGIIAITSGTSLLALGADVARGSKGAGDEQPSLSDLITTGGVIAPERLQLSMWTIVGVATIVAHTLSIGPARSRRSTRSPNAFSI